MSMDRYKELIAVACLTISVTTDAVAEYSSVRGWVSSYSGVEFYYSTPEVAIDAGLANNPFGWKLVRNGPVTITCDRAPDICGYGGGGSYSAYGDGTFDMKATAPIWSNLLGQSWGAHKAWRRIIPEGTPQVGPIPHGDRELFTRSNGAPSCKTGKIGKGNPILIATGNKFQQETDLTSNGPQPLILKRSYNSSDGIWRFNYQQRLVSSDAETLQVVRPDGQALTYTLANSTWSSDGDVYHQLEENIEGYAWKLTLQSGAVEYYDDQGRLVLLQSLQGQLHTLDYIDNSTIVNNAHG